MKLIASLRECNGIQLAQTCQRFQSRKICMNKCKGNVTTNNILSSLFQNSE